MPRITLSLVAALLLSVSVLADPAQAQTDAMQPSPDPIKSSSPSAPRMPLRLFKRSEQENRSAAGSRYGQPIELPDPKHTRPGDKRQPLERRATTRGNVTSVVLSSLAIVLGLFFLVVWLARRGLPKSATSLPTDVLEVLGRSPLANRHNLQLIRLGRRLLLVSVTPDNAETLAEITDPDEVNHLASLCQQHRPGSITSSFRQVLHQLGAQQPSRSRRSRETSDPLNSDVGATAGQRPSLRHMREVS